jgi:putative DNA base modification enzyme with NMAD domain
MKIVLSRKAFDSGSGGVPNPILPDGRLVPLPIPSAGDPQIFEHITINRVPLGPLVEDLTGNRIDRSDHCHVDPDLDACASARLPGWRPAFGQASAAQGHLSAHGVNRGDLFLFFGWFRAVEQSAGRWRYLRGAPDLHVIFGWIRIGEVLDLTTGTETDERISPFADHPHIQRRDRPLNTLYLAADDLAIGGLEHSGGGLFHTLSDERILTDTRQSKRSLWKLPACFHPDRGATLSYHDKPGRWNASGDQCRLSSAARGQEFVLALPQPELAEPWLRRIFGGENS